VQSQSEDGGPGSDASGTVDGGPTVDGAIDGGPTAEVFPSCKQLAKACGADGKDDCCNSPGVVGNTYYRGFDYAVDNDSGTQSFPATISDFRLDKYEVSVGRFRAFVAAGQGTQDNPPLVKAGARPNLPGSGWDAEWNTRLPANTAALKAQLACDPDLGQQTWTDAAGANETRPINCVSWYEAMAFCAWDGGWLPTEAEWMFAAGGGTQQRALAWSVPASSVAIDPTRGSYFDGTNCVGDNVAGCALTDLTQVGSHPMGDGRWGQSDLGGNVAEWMLDYTGPYPGGCTDCAQLAPTTTRQIRGGSFTDGKRFNRVTFKVSLNPAAISPTAGIRCARAK
jgi:formylglycine-generating enzyme required for sulfatase activity